MRYAYVRLGKDSREAIEHLDRLQGVQAPPVLKSITCKQVHADIDPGTFVFVGFGSDNNDGTQTPWKQGLRAIGTISTKTGGAKWQDECTLTLSVGYVFPMSIDKEMLLTSNCELYVHYRGMPVLGINNAAQQAVQRIQEDEVTNVGALLTALLSFTDGDEDGIRTAYPALATLLNTVPPEHAPTPTETQPSLAESGTETAADVHHLHFCDDDPEGPLIERLTLRGEVCMGSLLMILAKSKRFCVQRVWKITESAYDQGNDQSIVNAAVWASGRALTPAELAESDVLSEDALKELLRRAGEPTP